LTVRVGINGFGRIGRMFYRAVLRSGLDIDVVAANDLGNRDQMAHLLQFDSVAGRFEQSVTVIPDGLAVADRRLLLLSERAPEALPWRDLGVEVVVESTRFFTDREKAAGHLAAGARCVVVSAPATNADATFVVGVNEKEFDPAVHHVVSNASCTTNCFVPMVKVLDDAFGVTRALMTTVHAYTSEQLLVDGPHKDLRRARSAALNIVPTSTGAAKAAGLVMPELAGRFDGSALRVPVPDGSLTDVTALLSTDASVSDVNEVFRAAATDGSLSAVLDYSDRPIVSTDIVGSAASCTFDAPLTLAMGNLVKVFGWYDNEWGYSNRLVDLCRWIGSKLH
jgi:glyceraldehyde 3-phosphate dehydrogenase